LSYRHSTRPRSDTRNFAGAVVDLVIKKVIPAELMDANTKIYVNPTGRFVVVGRTGTRESPAGR